MVVISLIPFALRGRGRLDSATFVVPVSFAIQTFLPVVLEPIYLSERWQRCPLRRPADCRPSADRSRRR
jgi:hypothetical protein